MILLRRYRLYFIPTRLWTDLTMRNSTYKKQELRTRREHLCSHP